MAELNRQQMLKGQAATGQPIRPEYAPSTRKRKGFSTPNLYEKGDFQKDLFADVRSDSILFDSADRKTPWLTDRYGERIFGLTEESKDVIKDAAGEKFINRAKNEVRL